MEQSLRSKNRLWGIGISIVLFFCVLSFADVALAQQPVDETSGENTVNSNKLDTSKFPPELFPKCPVFESKPVNGEDKIAELFQNFKHYRLVIGAGEFDDDPTNNNRAFVGPTARLIDKQLDLAGYAPLPNLARTNGGIPYLEGKRAKKAAIRAALKEMALKLDEGDYGVIYYVGHGDYAPSHKDLTLSVYDRPVTDDDGIRLSDMVGILENQRSHNDVKQIPHYIIIIEACHSGIAVPTQSWTVAKEDDIEQIDAVEKQTTPPQIVIISATGPGSTAEAFNLNGTNLSAFAVFFMRALNEDWECVDKNQDGIITLNELVNYLKSRLERASQVNPPAIDGIMVPRATSREPTNFIAYSAKYHVIDGDRDEISNLRVTPKPGQISTVTTPSGAIYNCTNSVPCTIAISTTQPGQIQVTTQPISDPPKKGGVGNAFVAVFGKSKSKVCADCQSTSNYTREGSIALDDLKLASNGKVVVGVSIELQ